jgi:hypothetical protein
MFLSLSLITLSSFMPGWAQELEVQPIAISRSKVLAPIHINGTGPHAFILDLSIGRTVISKELAEFLKLHPMDPPATLPSPSGGSLTADMLRLDSFGCGAATAGDLQVLCMDLRPLTQSLGISIGGIFSGREVAPAMVLDIAGKRLTFVPAQSAPLEAGPRTLRFELNGGAIAVPVLINGKHVIPAMIDLSFAGTIAVPQRALTESGLMNDATPKLNIKAAPDQPLHPDGLVQVRAESLSVANQQLLNPVITVASDSDLVRLGLGFLKYFEISVDYRNQLLRLNPAQEGATSDPDIIGVGLTPATFNGTYWTAWVAVNSPAARLGVEPGAIITAIDGKDAAGLSYADIMRQLAAPQSKQLPVTIQNGTESRTVVLLPEKLL